MKYEMGVMDRVMILSLDTMPKVGNILTMRIKKALLNDVGFSEDEIRRVDLVLDGNQVTWNPDEDFLKTVEIGPEARKLLLEAMEKSQNLSEHYLDLYDTIKAGGEE